MGARAPFSMHVMRRPMAPDDPSVIFIRHINMLEYCHK